MTGNILEAYKQIGNETVSQALLAIAAVAFMAMGAMAASTLLAQWRGATEAETAKMMKIGAIIGGALGVATAIVFAARGQL